MHWTTSESSVELRVRDGAPKIENLACQRGLLPLPLRAIPVSRDSVSPTTIKDNRQFVANTPLLKDLIPGEGTRKAILASKFYGQPGQQVSASDSILVLSTFNSLFHEEVALDVLM